MNAKFGHRQESPRRANDLSDSAKWIIDLANLLVKIKKAIKDHTDLSLTPSDLALLVQTLQMQMDHSNQLLKAADHANERARRATAGRIG